MAIQIRRGTDTEWETNKSNIVVGEPAVTTDTGRFFVGTGTGTYAEFANKADLGDASELDYDVVSSGSVVVPTFDAIYPVGSIYMSVNNTSPATLFGGTWAQIKDTFLLSAGDTYTAGATGGEATHTLTESEIPSHKHPETVAANNGGIANLIHYYNDGIYDGTGVQQNNWMTSHALMETRATGGDQAHNNMPPYLVVYVWQRTA